MQTTAQNNITARKPRLDVIGLVLAIALPPVGAVVSIVALVVKIRSGTQGKALAIVGAVWGVIFSLPFLFFLWLYMILGGWKGNDAQKEIQPFLAQIQKAGGEELCDAGDSGIGLDNSRPWYQVYYAMPASPQLASKIKAGADQAGFSLTIDGDNHLYGGKDGRILTVNIGKEGGQMQCAIVRQGNEKQITKDDVVVDIEYTLPDRFQTSP